MTRAIGHYDIIEQIDSGSMATIYRVRDRRTGREHAIKMLHLDNDEEASERVLREGRAMLGLQHKNIVGVDEVINHMGKPGFVMDYVDGPTLDEWINDTDSTLTTRMALFHGIAEGLHHLHMRGVIHRDLQPANILIQTVDGVLVPRIIDLGLSKHVRDTGITDMHSVFGTLGYIAPEQIKSTATVGHRADIFSLGCILYVLACEAEPFDAESDLKLMDLIVATKYTPPREVVPDLPDSIVRAIVACLEHDPHKRIHHSRWVLRVLQGAPWPQQPTNQTPVPPGRVRGPFVPN